MLPDLGGLLRAKVIYFIVLLVADVFTSLLVSWNLTLVFIPLFYHSWEVVRYIHNFRRFHSFKAFFVGMQVFRLSFDSTRPARHAQLPDTTWHCTSQMKSAHSLAPGQFWLPNCNRLLLQMSAVVILYQPSD